jgi:chemotaxis family two-component system sensor kinase Cph1
VSRVASYFEQQPEAGDVTIEYRDLPVVHGDSSALTQVFQNLIGNAIKFRGEEAPQVRIEAKRWGLFWVVRVTDNGIGVDPMFQERIFEMFQRLHTRQEFPGTGIGLAVCRKIVNCLGGRIWVESEPGKGSTFFFTVPATPDQP